MKKRILNKLLCTVLAVSLTALLAACGGKPGQESTPDSQEAQSTNGRSPKRNMTCQKPHGAMLPDSFITERAAA